MCNGKSRYSEMILGSSYIQSDSASVERAMAFANQTQHLICREANGRKNIRHRSYRVQELLCLYNLLFSYLNTFEILPICFTVDV